MGSQDNTGMAMVALATLGLAFKGIFLKLSYLTGLAVEAGVVWRFMIALPLFWAFTLWRARREAQKSRLQDGGADMQSPEAAEKKAGMFALSRRQFVTLLACGVLFAIATWSDALAVDRLGAALSRLVLFTFPVFILFLEALRQRRLPGARSLLACGICYGGLALVMTGGEASSEDLDLVGLIAGLSSATSYAVFLVTGSSLVRQLGSPRFTAMTHSLTLLLVAFPALTLGQAAQPVPDEAWFWLVFTAVFSTFVPLLLLYEGMKRVGSEITGLLSYIGPGVTLFGAWLILDETMAGIQFAGVAFLFGGVMVAQKAEAWAWRGPAMLVERWRQR